MKNRNLILIEEGDLDELVDQVVKRIITRYSKKTEQWIDADEAMKLLGIKSATTLQKYRDEGRFRFSQKDRRIIKYDRFSINEYLEKNAKETF
ncbi:helix-turn-helix domain-containing protein [Fulvivirgaceae bacterium BMA10]|uniref:Helix-turn-helix domain-containing protein n=1 Tax=Splendidivirga corallicola TaxID=3051826 RepID=A0ABT8KLF6_9BACT|nr:helix-turn-helix domain-containing protein [Fulvivirgaceae bacterium BMA10]